MSDNPYQAPAEAVYSNDPPDPTLDRVASMLQQTKPWVRFISVITFLGSAFMVLGGLFMIFIMASGVAHAAAPEMAVVGFIYLVMAFIYIIPGVFLWKYADRIALFIQNRSTGTLASALEAQKSFWKFVGILMIIFIIFYAGFIFFVILGSILAAAG